MKVTQYVACTRCRRFAAIPAGLSVMDSAAFADAWLRLGCPHKPADSGAK